MTSWKKDEFITNVKLAERKAAREELRMLLTEIRSKKLREKLRMLITATFGESV